MTFRDHIIALAINGGIIAAIAILILTTSCSKAAPVPDPAETMFSSVKKALTTDGAKSVTVIAVIDSVDAGEDIQRQVHEEILSQLHSLKDIEILEYPDSQLNDEFKTMNISPVDGISPEAAVKLAEELKTGALLYASIESKTPDVHFKVFSGKTGGIIFAEMLAKWTLPVTVKEEAPVSPLSDASGKDVGKIGDASSSGKVKSGK
jgi:hypothetical protein